MADDRTVLLVEDDPNDELLTRRALESNKLANRIVVAHDGVEALAYLIGEGAAPGTPLPPLPEVVLLDLKLPRLNGLDVLRRLRAHPRTRLLPVVILTSSGEQRDVIDSYHLGANSYVQKPVGFDQFMEAARSLGLYWLVLNRRPPHARD